MKRERRVTLHLESELLFCKNISSTNNEREDSMAVVELAKLDDLSL